MSSATSSPSLKWTWCLWAIFAALLAFQPNYAWTDGARSAPYGSDFLQEWIGARVILSGNSDKLYDTDYTTKLQHDRSVVGYTRIGDSYYPMVYPPYWYIACAPFAMIPLKWAAPLWLGFIIAVWFFAIRFACQSDTMLGRAMSRSPQLGLIAGPLLFTFGMGQKSSLIAALLLLIVVLLEQKKFRRAGLLCALLAFKPHFAVLLGLPLIVRFGLPFLTGCLTTGLAWLLLTVAVDPGLLGEYIAVAARGVSGNYTAHAGYHLEDAHNWAGFFGRLLGIGAVSAIMTKLASIITLAAVLVLMARRRGERLTSTEWAAINLGLVLASPHLYGYDLAILIINAWLVVREAYAAPQKAIAWGCLFWYGLTVLPTLSNANVLSIQWSALTLAICFIGTAIHAWNPQTLGIASKRLVSVGRRPIVAP